MNNSNEKLPSEASYQESSYRGKLYLPELLTNEMATQAFGVSKSTLYKWREKYRMPFIRLGQVIFYLESSLEKWLKSRETENG